MAAFALTSVGDDRRGLVATLSAPITARGGSWACRRRWWVGTRFWGPFVEPSLRRTSTPWVRVRTWSCRAWTGVFAAEAPSIAQARPLIAGQLIDLPAESLEVVLLLTSELG